MTALECDSAATASPPAADRDMDVLRREASVVLAAHFPPGEFELQEHIDSETSFKNGKLLFALYLN